MSTSAKKGPQTTDGRIPENVTVAATNAAAVPRVAVASSFEEEPMQSHADSAVALEAAAAVHKHVLPYEIENWE